MARAAFGEDDALFRSVGFLASGESCPPLLLEALQEAGVDASHHRSYRIDEPSLRAADLVLTMEGQHVQKATMLLPEAFPRIMPLTQAARVIETSQDAVTTVADLVGRVNHRRDPSAYLGRQWDVDDPYGRRLKDYRRAVSEISHLVQVVIGGLLRSGPGAR